MSCKPCRCVMVWHGLSACVSPVLACCVESRLIRFAGPRGHWPARVGVSARRGGTGPVRVCVETRSIDAVRATVSAETLDGDFGRRRAPASRSPISHNAAVSNGQLLRAYAARMDGPRAWHGVRGRQFRTPPLHASPSTTPASTHLAAHSRYASTPRRAHATSSRCTTVLTRWI
jgi:hypothetical protein